MGRQQVKQVSTQLPGKDDRLREELSVLHGLLLMQPGLKDDALDELKGSRLHALLHEGVPEGFQALTLQTRPNLWVERSLKLCVRARPLVSLDAGLPTVLGVSARVVGIVGVGCWVQVDVRNRM